MTQAPPEGGPLALDYVFHPRSVAIVGVSRPQTGFGGVSHGFLVACREMGCRNLYPVNPRYEEIDGLRCYPSLRDIPGPVDHVISSVPARAVPALIDDCIEKGVRVVHFFTAGFRETGDEETAALEAEVVARCRAAGIRVLGPNCMGLYVPAAGLSFMPGFPREPGTVGFISQSGGNAGDMIFNSAARGVRYSKAVSYGNAADIGESELLEYLAEDPETEIIAAYIEGVRSAPGEEPGRRFVAALARAAAAKPTVVLKGGRTQSGARAVMSHTASLAGSYRVFEGLCRQVNAVLVPSVEEMVDAVVAFRFLGAPAGPRVAVVGGGGGFSVFAADELEEAGLECPVLPEAAQRELLEFTPTAGASVRNPVDTISIFEPPLLERTLAAVGRAENIDLVLLHTSFSWGAGRRSSTAQDRPPEEVMEGMIAQMTAARAAAQKPVAVVLRPPLDVDGMERTSAFQERCWRAGFPVFPTIPRAARALARALEWRRRRETRGLAGN